MRKFQFLCVLILSLLFFQEALQAKMFRNSYIRFRLDDNWNCRAESTEWVCLPEWKQKKKEAIIVFTAKIVGPQDSLTEYTSYLNKSKSIVDVRTSKPTSSKVRYVKKRQIKGLAWVDGFHRDSEIVNYYTRYLATVEGQIAVLITFSAHRDKYTDYSTSFIESIKSLEVLSDYLKPGTDKRGWAKSGAGGILGSGAGMPDPQDFLNSPLPEITGSSAADMAITAIFVLIILFVIFFLLYMKIRKRTFKQAKRDFTRFLTGKKRRKRRRR